eukprot:179851_1
MDPKNDESLFGVEVLASLDELSNVQKCRFLEYLSNCIGVSSGEIGIINAEIVRNWGTVRIFIQKGSSGSVVGAALLVKSDIAEDSLTICGLCYNEQSILVGQRLLESTVSTWEHAFSHLNLSVELSKQNEPIQRVAQDLGFIYDQDGSDDSWSRFVLCAHMKTESDSNTNEMSAEIDIRRKPQSSSSPTDFSSIHGQIRQFSCESCDQTFNQKCNLNRHINTDHEKLRPFACELCDKKFVVKGN